MLGVLSLISSMPAASKAPTTFARFHALDCRQRDACPLGKRLLINAKKRSGGPHLCSCDHLRVEPLFKHHI
jgi:hypothetical protein